MYIIQKYTVVVTYIIQKYTEVVRLGLKDQNLLTIDYQKYKNIGF